MMPPPMATGTQRFEIVRVVEPLKVRVYVVNVQLAPPVAPPPRFPRPRPAIPATLAVALKRRQPRPLERHPRP